MADDPNSAAERGRLCLKHRQGAHQLEFGPPVEGTPRPVVTETLAFSLEVTLMSALALAAVGNRPGVNRTEKSNEMRCSADATGVGRLWRAGMGDIIVSGIDFVGNASRNVSPGVLGGAGWVREASTFLLISLELIFAEGFRLTFARKLTSFIYSCMRLDGPKSRAEALRREGEPPGKGGPQPLLLATCGWSMSRAGSRWT